MRLSLLITLQEAELWQFTDTERNLCDQSCNCYWEQHPCLLINLKSIVRQWNDAIVLNCYFQIVTFNYGNIYLGKGLGEGSEVFMFPPPDTLNDLGKFIILWYINIIQYFLNRSVLCYFVTDFHDTQQPPKQQTNHGINNNKTKLIVESSWTTPWALQLSVQPPFKLEPVPLFLHLP